MFASYVGYEVHTALGYMAVYCSESQQMFRRNISLPYSVSKSMLNKNPGIYRRKQAAIEGLFVTALHWLFLPYIPTLKMEAATNRVRGPSPQ
jgi:hypothetical protein